MEEWKVPYSEQDNLDFLNDSNNENNKVICEDEKEENKKSVGAETEHKRKKRKKKKRYTDTDNPERIVKRKRRKRQPGNETECGADETISTRVGLELERKSDDLEIKSETEIEHDTNVGTCLTNVDGHQFVGYHKHTDKDRDNSVSFEQQTQTVSERCSNTNDTGNEIQRPTENSNNNGVTGGNIESRDIWNTSSLNHVISSHTDETIVNKKHRKKKKRLTKLQKASSKVGILPERSNPSPLWGVHLEDERKPETDQPPKTEFTEIGLSKVHFKKKHTDTSKSFPKPLWLCRIITRYPMRSFLLVSMAHVITLATTLGLVFSGSNIFPLVFDDLPLYIYNDARLKDLQWREKGNYDGAVRRPVYGFNVPTGYRSRIKDTVEVIYEKPGENILDSTYLAWIKTAEDRLHQNALYQDHYCLIDYYDDCYKPQSILRLFDGTYSHVDNVFIDPSFTNVDTVIYKASLYNETKEFLDLFLGKDSKIDPSGSRTSITRSFFLMGWPLGYYSDGRRGTADDLERFLIDTFKPEIENIRDYYLIERLEVVYISKIMMEHDVVEQALADIKLAIGSFVFIFVFMCFQTGSVVVSTLGILSILSSFLLTNLIYRYVFQFIYFGFFHVIAIFLILGIGADDLFVFYDTWRLTGKTRYPSDAHRLSDCYRKATKTTFVTSCTTMTAFFVSGLSPLLPVKTFGIFAGVLVLVNYIWVIIYFPTIIILHHTKIKNSWYAFHNLLLSICLAENMFQYKRRRSVSSLSVSETNSARMLIDDPNADFPDTNNRERSPSRKENIPTISKTVSHPENRNPGVDDNFQNGDCEKKDDANNDYFEFKLANDDDSNVVNKDGVVANSNLDLTEIVAESNTTSKCTKPKKNFEDRNRVLRFLKNGFYYFITLRMVKVVCPLLLVTVSIFFLYSATLIQPDTHQLRLFRDDHNYAKASSKHYFSFKRNNEDEYKRLHLVWGMLPADISSCNQKSAEWCIATPVWDTAFNMKLPSSQQAFKDLCNKLENLSPSKADRLRIRRDAITGKLQIGCFAKPFEEYFKAESERSYYGYYDMYPAEMNLTLPLTPGNVTMLMDANPYKYISPLPDDFDNNFEILVAYWLSNGYTMEATKDYFTFNNLFGERQEDGISQGVYYSTSGLYYGTQLQYLAIEVNTTMDLYSLGYKEGIPIYKEWEEFIAEINKEMPYPVNRAFQVTETLWHWVHVQETLATSAITGIMVGLFSAWPILVFTTLNYIIGTLAVIIIGLVTGCVVGLIPLVGWRLGVLESINLCMVVGLSVDYIVHLAEAYRMSKSTSRSDRVRDMLESIGLSVVSGALTTMGAAVFMLFAKIQFFFQFGIFILSTVGISMVFSLLGFTTVMALCGPQGDTGSVKKLALVIFKLCIKKDKPTSESEKQSNDIEPKPKTSYICVNPLERCFDWISYRKHK